MLLAVPPTSSVAPFTVQERARKAAAHPTLDWLYPVLAAVQGLEEALLVPPPAGQHTVAAWSSEVADKASRVAAQPVMCSSCMF